MRGDALKVHPRSHAGLSACIARARACGRGLPQSAGRAAAQVPRLAAPPAWRAGLALQDGKPVTPALVTLLSDMISRMNNATADLPALSAAAL